MKVLLDIKDDKAAFVMEVLRNFRFVRTQTITPIKELLMSELQEAVQEMNLIKSGKKQARDAEDFLNGV